MPEVKPAKAEAVKPEAPAPTQENFEWVEIPDETLLGDEFPKIRLNWDVYEPGQRYWVSKDVAGEIKRIIKTRMAYDRRILNPRADMKALADLHRNGRIPSNRPATDAELEDCLK